MRVLHKEGTDVIRLVLCGQYRVQYCTYMWGDKYVESITSVRYMYCETRVGFKARLSVGFGSDSIFVPK